MNHYIIIYEFKLVFFYQNKSNSLRINYEIYKDFLIFQKWNLAYITIKHLNNMFINERYNYNLCNTHIYLITCIKNIMFSLTLGYL